MLRWMNLLRRAFWRGVRNGMLGFAKAAAYSSILTLFPAFLVVASVLASTGTTERFIVQITATVGFALPPGAAVTAMHYFESPEARPVRVLISASIIMIMAAAGVMMSWMQAFERAYNVPGDMWGFWKKQGVAYSLVLLALVPLAFASLLVAFGNQIELWLAMRIHVARSYIVLLGTLLRWILALATTVAVLTLVYHYGLPRTQRWYRVLPGAVVAAVIWFPATITFGWYVTRFASYSLIYGPLGAFIVLLVYLYLVSVIVLLGAELNAMIYPRQDANPS